MQYQSKKIIVVMPVYNTAKSIENVFKRIPRVIYSRLFKVIMVNDGSSDNSVEVISKLRKKYKKIELISHSKNKGYGAAQKTGFNKAVKYGADIGVLLHSDGQYSPELLPKMLKPFNHGADIVMGSRILGGSALKGGMPLHRYLGNRFLTKIENIVYGMNISEFHTGYMLYSKKALNTINFNKLSNKFHFDGEMILMAGKKKLKIVEIPIPTIYAQEKSYLNPITYGFDVLKILFKYIIGKYNF